MISEIFSLFFLFCLIQVRSKVSARAFFHSTEKFYCPSNNFKIKTRALCLNTCFLQRILLQCLVILTMSP